VTAHLQGKVTLGAYALDAESVAHWLVMDADDDPGWQGLMALTRELAEQGMTGYLERSRRGGHLWLFTPPLSGTAIRRFGKYLLSQHGLEGMELFPKQDRLQTGVGSLVRLPFGIHRKTGRRYYFVTPDGEPLAPTIREQIVILSQPERVSQASIEGILASLPEPKPVFPTRRFRKQKGGGNTPSEKIKNRVSVLDFVSQFVDLDRNHRGLCPFHDDHVVSFQVNPEGNYWNCYAGCGGGSLIDFYMKWRELHGQDGSFTETIKELSEMLL
jgi:hypothetical protein